MVPVRVQALAVLFLMPVLAGCSGKDAAPVQEDPGTVIDEDDNIVVAPDMGAVRGTVLSEQGSRVPDARVQLTGTSFFATTGPGGNFLFTNVTPPEAQVRVEAQGFRVWEAPVAVEAGKVSTVNITLLADLGLDPDLRPHTHNMWKGLQSIVIMEETVPLNKLDPNDPVTATSAPSVITHANFERRDYDVPLPLPESVPGDALGDWPALVYPGTERIEVTLDWDVQDSSLDQLALVYSNATTSDQQDLDLKGPGETWEIVLQDPFSTDRGHQRFSLWEFWVNSRNEASSTSYRGPGHFLGGIDVKIEVFRGPEIPLEPAHPDFWKANTSMVILSGDNGHSPILSAADTYRDPHNPSWHDINVRGATVPPGTARMRLDFSWTYPEADGTAPGPDWVLTWRSADQRLGTPFSAYHRAQPVEGSHADQRLVYEFDVDPAQADPYYLEDSLWGFLISPSGMEDETFYPQWFRWRGYNPPTFFLEVTVAKG